MLEGFITTGGNVVQLEDQFKVTIYGGKKWQKALEIELQLLVWVAQNLDLTGKRALMI